MSRLLDAQVHSPGIVGRANGAERAVDEVNVVLLGHGTRTIAADDVREDLGLSISDNGISEA